MKLGLWVHRLTSPPSARRGIATLIEDGVAIDIGCGVDSPLTGLRPKVKTVGIDAFPDAVARAREAGAHDCYLVADVLSEDVEPLLKDCGIDKVDLVSLIQVIEHLPKRAGYELLERCESLTSKYVVVETPNGFRPQGPEFGNEFQRHLSGWFVHDFEGLGYGVTGTTGTKYLRGYASGPRFSFRGCLSSDLILARFLGVRDHPRHAYNLLAVKDVRGVRARL